MNTALGAFANLSPEIRETLESLSRPIEVGQVPALKIALTEYVNSIKRAAEKSSFIDMPLVYQLQNLAMEILNRFSNLDLESQKVASCGIKYFLLRDDAKNGFLIPGGFEDDALVLAATENFISKLSTVIQ